MILVTIQARPDRFSTAIFDLTIIPNGKICYPNDDFGSLSGLERLHGWF
jgi:hypothetical protein